MIDVINQSLEMVDVDERFERPDTVLCKMCSTITIITQQLRRCTFIARHIPESGASPRLGLLA